MRTMAVLFAALLFHASARAQVYVVPPPPPVVVVPPPPAPFVRHRRLARVFLGVGIPLLAVGFFALVAGIPVTVLTHTHRLCSPAPSCEGSYALSYGLLGGGGAAMLSGIALTAVGRVFSLRARFGALAPRLALSYDAAGRPDGAAASMTLRF